MAKIDSLYISDLEEHISELNNIADSLQGQIETIRTKTDLLYDIVETSNDSIANQLSATNVLLALIAIILTVGGAIIGLYIRKKKLEVEAMVSTVDEKKKTVDQIANATEELDKQIHSNLKDLYQQLREEETCALLDRLILEPRDISNLLKLLLARDLKEHDFAKLREAYLKLKSDEKEEKKEIEDSMITIKIGGDYDDNYILVFFQHFCNQAVKDDIIRPELIRRFYDTCDNAFKRDIIKSTIDISKAISDNESSFNKEEVLTAFLKALNHSKHRNLSDLRNILEQNITPQTLLDKAKEQCVKDKEYLSLFGMKAPVPDAKHSPDNATNSAPAEK